MTQFHDISQSQSLEYWKDRAAEFASELYIIDELLANPNTTDKEKVYAVVYERWYQDTPPARPDGSRYYNAQAIATRMGGSRVIPERPSPKEQAISPVHTKFKRAGLITTAVEAQKFNKSRENQFDLLSPQFTMNARGFALEKSDKAGGRGGIRVPKHRGCGGDLVADPATFHCLKCFQARIPNSKDYVLMVDISARCEECGMVLAEITNGYRCVNEDCGLAGVIIASEEDATSAISEEENPNVDLPTLDSEIPDIEIELPTMPDAACIKCGRPRRVCFALTPENGWWYTCTAEMWARKIS